MINKIDDIYINNESNTIEQKVNLKMFLGSICTIMLIIIINIYTYFYVYDPKHIVFVLSVIIIGFILAFTPQFINNTKVILKNDLAVIKKYYLFGIYKKEEKIQKDSIILSKIITKQYELNKEHIRYWIVSPKYSRFYILRLRNPKKINFLRELLSSVFKKEITYRTIFLNKHEPNKFID